MPISYDGDYDLSNKTVEITLKNYGGRDYTTVTNDATGTWI